MVLGFLLLFNPPLFPVDIRDADPGQSSTFIDRDDRVQQARNRPGVDRIQFALAGINAHINHDLALALLETDDELHMVPALESPEHDDYEQVNGLLEELLPAAMNFLVTGIVGELAQDTGMVGRLLPIWDIRTARNLAWDFASHLRSLAGASRDLALEIQDKLAGAIGQWSERFTSETTPLLLRCDNGRLCCFPLILSCP